MNVTKIRAALATFAAVGVIAATGVASAAAADTLGTLSLVELRAEITRASTDPTRLPVLDGYTIARVDGESTGDGPADDEECEAHAELINDLFGLAFDALLSHDPEIAGFYVRLALDFQSDAEGRGCWFKD